ncbi:DUF2750 domain-containing protein [Agromyces mariniharenae]|uniref:DUF2750 domain-containing protein n=1 Tax=Agromyces mariniharenae TaxID=2604423 RepID=UPI001EE61DA3|nr:DUF2750 domain-containing protein [Agromyces mariniharenae]
MSAAQADAFYREVLTSRTVWTVRDADGFPAPMTPTGQRAQPFWSKQSRAQRIVDAVPAYAEMEIVEIPLVDWRERWLPGLERDGLLVGINWSGRNATGYDRSPADVLRILDTRDSMGG